jgi:hypothetical protein
VSQYIYIYIYEIFLSHFLQFVENETKKGEVRIETKRNQEERNMEGKNERWKKERAEINKKERKINVRILDISTVMDLALFSAKSLHKCITYVIFSGTKSPKAAKTRMKPFTDNIYR